MFATGALSAGRFDVVDSRPLPVIAAPMAGGISTVELAVAVSDAGGLGFLAGGYLRTRQLYDQIAAVRTRTSQPFGVNIFVPGSLSATTPAFDEATTLGPASTTTPAFGEATTPEPASTTTPEPNGATMPAPDHSPAQRALDQYTRRLRPLASRLGVELGACHTDDDEWLDKLELLRTARVPVASFTFGCPPAEVITDLHAQDVCVVVTVTSVAEALLAQRNGADALCVQGMEAGGHRATFTDDPDSPTGGELVGLLPLLRQVRDAVALPVIAAGGLMTGADVASVVTAGAAAAQLGTAFLCCPEAGTAPPHRRAILDHRYPTTAITRAFTGRPARGLANEFVRAYTADAPAAYPAVHHVTRPLRAAASAAEDPELMSLWAGQGVSLSRAMPAAELVETLATEARTALVSAHRRFSRF